MGSYGAELTPKLTNVLPKHTAGVLTHLRCTFTGLRDFFVYDFEVITEIIYMR